MFYVEGALCSRGHHIPCFPLQKATAQQQKEEERERVARAERERCEAKPMTMHNVDVPAAGNVDNAAVTEPPVLPQAVETRVEPETGIVEGEPSEIMDSSNANAEAASSSDNDDEDGRGKGEQGEDLEEGEMEEEEEGRLKQERPVFLWWVGSATWTLRKDGRRLTA